MIFKKLALLLLTVIVSYTAYPSPASADNRMSISASSQAVLMGSVATFTPTVSGVSDSSSYDWGKFKWEITTAVGRVSDGYVSVWQLNTAPCPGATTGASGSYRTCTIRLGSERTILQAPTTFANATAAVAKINVLAGAASLRLRIWVDRNDNNEIDPFEPSAKPSTIQIMDPNQAKAFFNLQMDPPVLADNKLRATLTPNGSVSSNFGIAGLVDPNLLSIKFVQCSFRGCTTITGSSTWVNHPQLLQYELAAEATLIPNSGYGAQLIYTKAQNETYILASKQIDYRSTLPASVSTSLSSPNGLSFKSNFKSPHSEPRQKTYLANTGLSTFVYQATVKDKDDKPIENQQVFILFDLKDISYPDQLIVNGSQITNKQIDQVVIARNTDSEGKIKLNISYGQHSFLDRIEIETLINGYRSWEYPGLASEEVITWDSVKNRVLNLSFSRGASSSETNKYLTLQAQVTDREGRAISGERVLFGSDAPVQIDDPVVSLLNGSASTNIRLGNFLESAGNAKVYAQVIGESGMSEATALVSWTNNGETISGSLIPGASSSPVAGPVLGASVKRASATTVSMTLPGTTQIAGVVFLVNGKAVKATKGASGLSKKIALVDGKNSFKILVNGVVAAEANFSRTQPSKLIRANLI